MPVHRRLSAIGQYGENLFQRYLDNLGVPYEHEPIMDFTTRRIDFVLSPPGLEKIYIEVKTIYVEPPRGASVFHPYNPVRSEITEGMKKFRKLPDALNAIAVVNFPGSFQDIRTPHVMLGAMYGDAGFQIPFNTATSQGDREGITETFIRKDGMMLRGDRIQNSRLSAIISVHNLDTYMPDFSSRSFSIGEAASLYAERTMAADFAPPYVTVWDNGAGKRTLPSGLFQGTFDARWSYNGSEQFQAFVGPDRRAMQLEGVKRGRTIY